MPKTVLSRDIIADSKEQGVDVSLAQVSTTLRSAGFRRSRGKKAAASSAAGPANGAAGHGLNLEALLAIKKLS
jgi:hypothetical protein